MREPYRAEMARFTLEAVPTICMEPEPTAVEELGLAESGEGLKSDPRWLLIQQIASGRHFSRSPLLCRFLLYIVTESIEGRQDEITERQIGVHVFGRPNSYRTVEDNIVRNYARQLRKRLAEHFAEDEDAPMRIEIPVGGYVPVFTTPEPAGQDKHEDAATLPLLGEENAERQPEGVSNAGVRKDSRTAWWSKRPIAWIALLLFAVVAYSSALVWFTRWAVHREGRSPTADEPLSSLWQTILDGPEDTYIVPPDAGLNLVEDLSHRPLPLADYIQSGYSQLPLPGFDGHSADDLRMHELTDFKDLQIITSLTHLPEYNAHRVSLRFPRDLRLDDLKNANALIVGSVCSNPWAAIADEQANFRVVCGASMQTASIVNKKPRAGEAPSYVSHWNEATHATYALILLLPNLSGDGHLLLLEGLDVAGTQAAAEVLLQSNAIAPILQRARRPDGSLGYFEVLLRATSIQSNATDTQVIASRID
jgi:hypothetical protein